MTHARRDQAVEQYSQGIQVPANRAPMFRQVRLATWKLLTVICDADLDDLNPPIETA
jgi:hypothetical protein